MTLPDSEARHLSRVLRLHQGDAIVVFDGHGREWNAHVTSISPDEVSVRIDGERPGLPEPTVRVTLGVGVLKGDQMDSVIRDATALGVTTIAPCVSAHVAVSERAIRARSIERWQRVAVASAKQCGRSVVPAILPIRPFEDVLNALDVEVRLVCLEPAAGSAATHLPERPGSALLLVGPEGGWSRDELDKAQRAGARGLNIGPRTLRAETAPTVALSVLWSQWGWH
jgi:16S rRNA (uracil1498-N3)-methyltransferase